MNQGLGIRNKMYFEKMSVDQLSAFKIITDSLPNLHGAKFISAMPKYWDTNITLRYYEIV